MIKEKLTLSCLILGVGSFLLSIFSFWFLGMIFYSFVIKYTEIKLFEALGIIVFSSMYWFIAKNMWRFFLKFLVPSVYCIRYIKKYINRKELKEILKNENFEKIAITKNDEGKFDFFASENWLYINRLYIPKAMILNVSLIISTKSSSEFLELNLLNKKNVSINNYTTKSNCKFRYEMKRTKRIIPNAYLAHLACPYTEFENKYIEKFLNEIKTKEDFLDLVKKDYFFTRKEIKGEFLKQKLQKEKIRRFYDEEGDYCEEYTTPLGEIFVYEAEEGEESNL